MRQEQSGLDPSHGVIDQGCVLLPLFLRNGGPEVLNFDQPLAHENNLGDIIDAGHPRIADQLRIESGNAGRLFWISRGAGLPFQNAACAVEFTNGIDVGEKIVARTEHAIELNLLA